MRVGPARLLICRRRLFLRRHLLRVEARLGFPLRFPGCCCRRRYRKNKREHLHDAEFLLELDEMTRFAGMESEDRHPWAA